MKARLRDYYTLEKGLLTLFLSTSFLVGVMDVFSPIVVQRIIDEVIPAKDMLSFYRMITLLTGLYILRFFIALLSHSRGQLMGNKIKFHMKNDLYKKIMGLPYDFFKRSKQGDLISRLTGDLESSSALLYKGLEDSLFTLLALLGSFIIMMKFNTILAIATIGPLPFILYFTYMRNLKLKEGYISVRRENSTVTSEIQDSLKTIFFIKDNLLEGYKGDRFIRKNIRLLDSEKRTVFNLAYLMSGIAFYNNITQLIIICVGGHLFIEGKITMGIIISFLLITNRFRVYLMKLMSLIDVYQRGMAGIVRFKEVMDIDLQEEAGLKMVEKISRIEFRDLYFAYESKGVLNKINLTIQEGEKVAFVGESGIGKSTLLSLLKKAINPTDGKILVNGRCITELDRESYMEKLGIVDQNEHIMNVTLRENIEVVFNGEEDRFEESIEKSRLNSIVRELSKGYDTLLGDGGTALSTGQQQRVSLARLFIKDPDVILLDEATSTLDNITEFKIMENIHKDFKDKIVIAVAHRLNTLKDFDRIFVLGEEGIIESGSFRELLKAESVFKRMYMGG